MKNVLFVCPLSPSGHKGVNKFFVDTFSKEYRVTFMARKHHLCDIDNTNIYKVEIPDRFFNESNNIRARLSYFKILMWISKSFYQYDSVFFLSYEIFSFCLYSLLKSKLFKNRKIYLLASNQVDEINSNIIKKYCWNLISNNFYHVVKEKIMQEYIDNNFENKKVIFIKRSKNNINNNYISTDLQYELSKKYKIDNNKKIIISPSKSSTDYIHINAVLSKLPLDEYEIIILAKKKHVVLNKPGVKVIEGFLDEMIFYNLIAMSSAIWMPYRASYNYRSSTVLLEMVELEKPILARRTGVFDDYFKKYQIGELYDNESEFEKKLAELFSNEYQFRTIKEDFSNKNVMKDMLNQILL